LSRIREEYVQTGKVQFVYKHFAILGPESVRAAAASECAAEQDAFWDFHDVIFADQVAGHSSLSEEKLVNVAGNLGLDSTTFSQCLSAGRYTEQIQRESRTVQALGVRGTPGFLVNGVFISGAQPFEVFQQVIDEQLAAVE
jgi:protein-disulfide isomerase